MCSLPVVSCVPGSSGNAPQRLCPGLEKSVGIILAEQRGRIIKAKRTACAKAQRLGKPGVFCKRGERDMGCVSLFKSAAEGGEWVGENRGGPQKRTQSFYSRLVFSLVGAELLMLITFLGHPLLHVLGSGMRL